MFERHGMALRVVVLRRPVRSKPAAEAEAVSQKKSTRKAVKQLTLDLPELVYQGVQYEYVVLVTSLTDGVRTVAQHYRDRGDAENNFDELKNQWGWAGSASNLFTSLDSLMGGMKQPGLTSILNIPEILEWVIVFLLVVILEAAVWVVIAWGFVASAVCVLLGPVLIPFFIVPQLEWMFWGWLKAFVQYSFYPVVANAVIFVFGRLLTGYIAANSPPWDGAQQWALLAPMLIMMVAFTFGVLKIPTLVNDIFAGRSGSSALPSKLI